MKTKVVNKDKVKPSETVTTSDSTKTSNVKSSKTISFIVTGIIVFFFMYIIIDQLIIRKHIEQKIMIVNEKFDSLEVMLDNKMPLIDQAIQQQEQQLRDLQELSQLNKK